MRIGAWRLRIEKGGKMLLPGIRRAAIARRAEYEPARQTVSQFFTTLQIEVAKGDSSGYTRA